MLSHHSESMTRMLYTRLRPSGGLALRASIVRVYCMILVYILVTHCVLPYVVVPTSI